MDIEERNELSDILLEQRSSGKAVKVKRLIVVAVLLILLFVLVLMIMKFISKPDDDTSSTLTDSMLQQTPPQTVVDTPLFTDANDTLSNDSAQMNTTVDTPIVNNDIIDVSSNISPSPSKPATKSATSATKPAATTSKPASTPKSTTTVKPATPASKSTASSVSSALKGHYVQVGSFSKSDPDKDFLNKITSRNYKYVLYKTGSGSIQVLIGPFEDAVAARAEIPAIHGTISKDAFYKQIK